MGLGFGLWALGFGFCMQVPRRVLLALRVEGLGFRVSGFRV